MPKDNWRRASDQLHARRASQEFAEFGRFVSYESVYDDLIPADKVIKVSSPDRIDTLGSDQSRPSSKNKRIVSWLNRLRNKSGLAVRIPIITAIPKRNEQTIIPLLIYALAHLEPSEEHLAIKTIRLIGTVAVRRLIDLLSCDTGVLTLNATQMLGNLGKEAIEAIPKLEKLVRKVSAKLRKSRQEVEVALKLTKLLCAMKKALFRLGGGERIAQSAPLAALLNDLSSSNCSVVRGARETIIAAGPTLVPDLISHLEIGIRRCQRNAIRALVLLKHHASPALPYLQTLANTANDLAIAEDARRAILAIKCK